MRKLILALAAVAVTLAFATPAEATVNWSKKTSPYQVSKAVCSSGTETGTPPTTNPCSTDQGLCLNTIGGFTVRAEASSTFTAGGYWAAYLWEPDSKSWARAPDLDLYVDSTLSKQSWAGFEVVSRMGGIAFLPQNVGVAAVLKIIGK